MKTAEEGKELTIEIAELLQNATQDQKLVIKGILLGAKEFNRKPTRHERKTK